MRKFLSAFLWSLIVGSAVPKIKDHNRAKTAPEHVGIAQEIYGFETMYVFDAMIHGLKFKSPVTMGFTTRKMKVGNETVVGLCTYGKNFREIDIDLKYWNESTWTTKRTLIYHEMTHCLCTRFHTYKNGTYPEIDSTFKKIIARVQMPFYKNPPGFYPDKCPLSIMYPYVVSDECIAKHWPEYENEMFEGCNPY